MGVGLRSSPPETVEVGSGPSVTGRTRGLIMITAVMAIVTSRATTASAATSPRRRGRAVASPGSPAGPGRSVVWGDQVVPSQ